LRVSAERGELGAQPRERRGVLGPVQRVQGPGDRDRRGLMAGDDQEDELIAELFIAHRLAIVVTSLEHDAQDVLARPGGAPRRDERVERVEEAALPALERRERADAAEFAAQRRNEREEG